jgi:hypothetical protein
VVASECCIIEVRGYAQILLRLTKWLQ